jgi:SNF2 family DNA or RNA helicase
VGNPQTAGYGLTLTAANNVIYYANDYNLETRMQSEDRCHRIGQDSSVLYVDLVTPGTVDINIAKALQQKINLAGATLGEEVKKWLQV